ncbi:death-inducer obliterator 1 [Brachyhypopomus gauderio]|uniref:death-inducer obliterator 1 n=1 Tax=Brachyhypopomus gauderio TaxID=698409 RepID=UPI004041D121
MEERVDQQQILVTDSSTKEAPKTWGFRRTTIAKREFLEEIGSLDISSLTPRRSTRQGRGRGRGRGKQACDTPTTPAPKRGRGARKVVEPAQAPSPEPGATPELGGGESDVKLQGGEGSGALFQTDVASAAETGSEAPVSDQAEDSDDLTLRELQERARARRSVEEVVGGAAVHTDTANAAEDSEVDAHQKEVRTNVRSEEDLVSEEQTAVKGQTAQGAVLGSSRAGRSDIPEKQGAQEEKQEHETCQSVVDDDGEEDPNALYCICRQKHNNRFMICCDRCQEWFHGDCVGITASRGRLLEENGEDYICPSCSPCQSPVDALRQPVFPRAAAGSSSESSGSVADRLLQLDGIKGKIRKTSHHSTKRKIRMFQSVEIVEAASEAEKSGPGPPPLQEEGPSGESAGIPQCIGPGCANEALPESVYCGHQCIIRHAAVAMQSLSEPTTLPAVQPTKPSAPKPALKIQKSFLEKLFRRKPVVKPAEEDDGGRREDLAGSLEKAEPTTAPLSNDPGRQTTGVEMSSPITSSVFYKSTVKEEKEVAESKADMQHLSPNPSSSSEDPAALKTEEKTCTSTPPPRKPALNPLPSRAKKTMPGSPRLAGLRQLTEVAQVSRNTTTISKMPGQSEPVSSTHEQAVATTRPSPAPELRVLPVTPAPVPPSRPLHVHPNMQMRQDVRRSLSSTLMKRANEIDNLNLSENDAEKLAVNIEREMFNLYYTTDNKYKNKYRSLLLTFKDPKNKGLFFQVLKGQITPFKLTRMSEQDLQSLQEIAGRCVLPKDEASPVNEHVLEPVPVCEERAVKTESITPSGVRHGQTRKATSGVSDAVISVLQDTTSKHRTHLFDLKCRICTGQISGDKDPEPRKMKKEEAEDEKEEKEKEREKERERTAFVVHMPDNSPTLATVGEAEGSYIMESPASPVTDDPGAETAPPDYSPLVIPAVSVVSITRRDPRTAPRSSAPPSDATTSASPQIPPQNLPPVPTEEEKAEEVMPAKPLPLAAPLPMPKSILMKPTPAVPRFYHASTPVPSLVSSHTPSDSETSQFLSTQHTLWKGFLNMQSVAKFVTKGYLISGSAELLKKDLPDTIHVGGRILPQTVWEYIERVKTSVTKELSLIRFHPASDEEQVAYVSLFSYFNSRRRFGVVSNICNNIKDLYLIPLCAEESVPSVLLPLEGPGLEQNRPNLLIGLAICQKLKRLGALPTEMDEKRPRIQVDPQVVTTLIKPAVSGIKQDESGPYDPNITISTTPPGSPPSIGLPDSSSCPASSLFGPSSTALPNILPVGNPLATISAVMAKATSSAAPLDTCISSSSTPLQTILNTLFGKKKQGSDVGVNASDQSSLVVSPTVDPIVQQYQQTPKNTVIEKVDLDDDRPYDPEEEYDPGSAYQSFTPSAPAEISKPLKSLITPTSDDDRPYDPEEEYNLRNKVDGANSFNAMKSSEIELSVHTAAKNDDIAYDPEDDTVFEEMQTFLLDKKSSSEHGVASAVSLSEQQKMLEELNRQIEEQKRQLEEQEEALRLQRAAVGVSMAHFSVSDALMSPPPRFGRDPEEATEKTLAVPAINPNRDPRQIRNSTQDAVSDNLATGHNDKENTENWESFRRRQALTLSTFLAPSVTSVLQNMSSIEQDLDLDLKKDSDMSLATKNTADKSSNNNDKTGLCSDIKASTHLNASELQDGIDSSCANEKTQLSNSPPKASSKTRRSHTSTLESQSSSQKRSRHDRRLQHKERDGHVSKNETDSYRRRGRHSPERSARHSHSHSHRKDRVSSRQRDRHHHRSTSSSHRHRRDRPSARSHSAHSGKSAQLESDQSHQRHQSPSRQSTESAQNNIDQAQGRSPATSRSPQIHGGKSQNDFSEDREQDQKQNRNLTKSDTDQSHHSAQPFSDLPDNRLSNNDQFQQREQLPLGPNSKQRGKLSQTNTEPLCHEELNHDNSKTHPSEVSPLQRDDFIQDTSQKFHHRNQSQSFTEHSLVQQCKDNQIHSLTDRHCSQRGNILHNDFSHHTDEQVLCSRQSQMGKSTWHKSDHTSHIPPNTKTVQKEKECFPELDTGYSRNQPLSGPPKMFRGHVSDTEAEPCFNRDLPSLQRPNFVQDAGSQPTQRSHPQRPPQMQRRDFALDEADQCLPKRQLYVDERDFPLSEPGILHQSSEKYSGNLPLEEKEPQLHFLNNPPQMPSQKQRGHFLKDDTNQFHHQEYLPQGANLVGRDVSQGEHDIARDLHSRDQFRPRAPNDQWKGPRGPCSIMAPIGPTPMQLKGPRVPHPERFERCEPVQNFGPRGPYPRQRIFENVAPSPNIGPRGPSSGPGMFKDTGPQSFGPRGSNPDSEMFEGASPQYGVPKGRFPGPGRCEGSGPQNFGPRGSSPGSAVFENFGPSPRPSHPRHAMDRPRGTRQSRHEGIHLQPNSSEPRDPFQCRELPCRQFDDRDSQLPHFNVPRDFATPHQFDGEHYDPHRPDFNRPRGHAPPQEFDDKRFDSNKSQLANINCSRDCGPSRPFDEAESDNRGFSQECTYMPRRHGQSQYLDESRNLSPNTAKEGFPNPHEARHHRELTPPHVRRRKQAHPRNPRHGSPPCDQHECPPCPNMESEMRGTHCFNEFGEHEVKREMGGPRFARPNVFEGGRGCERDAQLKGPRFNPPQNCRGQRAPSPQFHAQRMPVPQNKQLLGPTVEPNIRPLRLSGPLLPTPPGGPIRLNHPRMQRPHPYKDHNWPQGPPTRGQMNELCNRGVKPGCFDDSNHQQRETTQSLMQEKQGEESGDRGAGSQDSSPGKPWRRRSRRREGRIKVARRQSLTDYGDKRDNMEGAGITEGERNRDTNPNIH